MPLQATQSARERLGRARERARTGARVPRAPAVKRGIQATLVSLTALLALCIGAGIYAAVDLYHSGETRYVGQALPLRTATRDLVLQMVNEETAVRGYMISRNRSTLRPYFSGRYGVRVDLTAIARLGGNDPELRRRLAMLRSEIHSVEAWLARQITFIADSRAGQLRAQRDLLQGQGRFERFRRTAAAVSKGVDRFVDETRSRQRRTYRLALGAIVLAGAGALLISLALLRRVPERLRALYAAEEEARARAEQEANAARALAHIRDAVVLLDESGRIRLWNPGAEHLFGVDAGEALARPLREVVPDLAAVVGDDEGETSPSLFPVRARGGERWVAASSTGFEGGRVLAVRDLTEEHELERIRTDFVATVSHELRTPVTAVYGAAQTLSSRAEELTRGAQNRLMQVIEQEAQRLADITDQMLAAAQLDQERLTLSPSPCDLHALCLGIVESVRLRAPESVAIALVAPSDLPPVACDAQWLRQVLVNLLDNAVKYSPDGGLIEVRIEDEPSLVRIAVSDEGLGIAPADRERIFEKFYRADPQMTRGIGGSGLGLYLSREIVARMGGTLTVEPKPGGGSLFVVELPRAATLAPAAEREARL